LVENMLENFLEALIMVGTVETILVILISGFFGLLMGALPGMTATLAVALLLPFTLFMDPVPAIAAIITMSAMAIFAGDIPGALLRIPGTPSSAAYVDDAYRMTQNGKGVLALGGGLLASALGGLFGTAVLILFAPAIGAFALQFTSFEYFWVAVLGLTTAVVISQGSQLKGGISLMIGLMVSTVGIDITLGIPRFTFGSTELTAGISFIPVMIGLFGISQVMINLLSPDSWSSPKVSEVWPKGSVGHLFRSVWKLRARLLSGSAIGGAVGSLPGAGSDIAAWVAYAVTKNTSKRGHLFGKGKGEIEPIIGASSANNSSVGAAYIPTLAFGIPGDTVTAILVGVLLMKGITPGPELFSNDTSTLYSIFILFIVANILMIPLGLAAIRLSTYIVNIPRPVLLTTVVSICIIGSFAVNNSVFDIILMLIFGVLGYLLTTARVPLAPIVLGIVLGPIVERSFMQSMIATSGDLTQFVTRPISAIMMCLVVLVLSLPFMRKVLVRVFRGVRRKEMTNRL